MASDPSLSSEVGKRISRTLQAVITVGAMLLTAAVGLQEVRKWMREGGSSKWSSLALSNYERPTAETVT